MTNLHIDREQTLELLQSLIRVPSINPSLVEGGCGEREIANYVAKLFTQMGLEIHLQELGPNRSNVIGVLKGSGGGRSLMLNGHLDTVGIEGVTMDPFAPIYRDGKVYGRGSQDMKGGLAAMIMAAQAVIAAGVELKGDLILAAVADEEYASIGTEAVVREYSADAGIVCEPTDLGLCLAHRGFAWEKVTVHGVAAHGSLPQVGVDAIVKAGKFLGEVERLGSEVLVQKEHPLLDPPSIHASLIRGGKELSTYPDLCELQLERRTIPGEDQALVQAEMEQIIARLAEKDPAFRADLDVFFVRSPMEIAESAPIVQTMAEVYQQVTGQSPEYVGTGAWLDSAVMAEAGIPTLVFGPSGEGAHAAVEWVDFDTVMTTAKVLAGAIVEWCGQ